MVLLEEIFAAQSIAEYLSIAAETGTYTGVPNECQIGDYIVLSG